MNLDLYRILDPNFIMMLKLNFRSHKTILTLPNKLFYDNQLKVSILTNLLWNINIIIEILMVQKKRENINLLLFYFTGSFSEGT